MNLLVITVKITQRIQTVRLLINDINFLSVNIRVQANQHFALKTLFDNLKLTSVRNVSQ